eukprot:6476103-Amphidinium_carterae.1
MVNSNEKTKVARDEAVKIAKQNGLTMKSTLGKEFYKAIKVSEPDYASYSLEKKEQIKKDWIQVQYSKVTTRLATSQDNIHSTEEANEGHWYFRVGLIKLISKREFKKVQHLVPRRSHPVSGSTQYLWVDDSVRNARTLLAKQSQQQDCNKGKQTCPPYSETPQPVRYYSIQICTYIQ